MTARGDRREAIYEGDTDREHFLEVLGQVVGQFNWRCHAYCLMSNHRHHRTGHLFQGRYKAILVDADSYLLELTPSPSSGSLELSFSDMKFLELP